MLSIVIPVYNEMESLAALHEELSAVAAEQKYDAEFIFVDDGSEDGSWGCIRTIAASDPRVRGIRFRRRFGKAAALNAGFRDCRGELIVTLDADLQDDPHEIPKLLAKLNDGCDVVSGWKQVRHDPWHKVAASRVFNWLVSRLTGVKLHDHNCGMKCYRREVFDEVRLYGELHRFVPVLAAARGFRWAKLSLTTDLANLAVQSMAPGDSSRAFSILLTVKFLTGFSPAAAAYLGSRSASCLSYWESAG